MLLHQILVSITHQKIYKIHAKIIDLNYMDQRWMKKIELLDGTYSISKIQDYFEYIIKKYETITDDPPIIINVDKIENKSTFRANTEYYLELLTSETMKLRWSTKTKITKDDIGENETNLEVTEVTLVHCNIVNNDYQQDPRILNIFVRNRLFGQLVDI